MASSDSDTVPYAMHTHTLMPLDIAYSRNDIRRREEAFEGLVITVDGDLEHPVSLTPSSASCPSVLSRLSTLPSDYSCSSWTSVPLCDILDTEDSVLAVYEVYEALTLRELGYDSATDEAAVCRDYAQNVLTKRIPNTSAKVLFAGDPIL